MAGQNVRYSKGHGSAARREIIDAASKLMCAGGLDVSIVDVMKMVGLTHGGFYFHFKGRQDLVDKSISEALRRTNERILQWLSGARDDGLATVVRFYLSTEHRDEVGAGCPLPALGSNIARMPVAVRRGFCRELEATIGLLARQYNDLPRDVARREAMAAVATMLGSILLARSANDPHLSDGMLAAGRGAILDATADGVRYVGAARSARANRRRRAAPKRALS